MSNAYNLYRKSQIAIEYCFRFRDIHPDAPVFWVNASSTISFKYAYSEIASRLKLIDWNTPADRFRSVYDWFQDEANGRWLLVLDNADDPRVLFDSRGDTQIKEFEQEDGIRPLAAYVPHTANGSILVTSRNRKVAFHLTNNERSIIDVESMGPEQTLSLVQSRLIDEKSSSEEKEELIERLDFIPLAITQAAAFINSESVTVPQYSKLLLEATDELLLVDAGDDRRDAGVPSSCIQTWYLSFDLVNRDAPAAAHLMSLMCTLDRQKIPEFLIRNQYEDGFTFDDVLAPLIEFSLISAKSAKEGGRTFEIHRLVRIAMATWLEKHNLTAKYREEALRLLSRHFSEEDDLETGTSAVVRQLSHLLSSEPEGLHASETMETASIMSIEAPSLVSATTLPSSVPAEDAAQEFALLLFHDEVLHPLLFEASRKVEIERLKRNFAKLLYIYAGDLREEAAEVLEMAAVDLVKRGIQYITNCVWDFFGPTKDSKSQAMERLLAQTSKREDRLKRYLQNLMPEDIYPSELQVIETMQVKPVDEIVDEDSEPEDSEPAGPISDVNFIHTRKFLTETVAFAKLRQNFRDFLTPEPKSMQPPPSEHNFLDSAIETPPQTSRRKGIDDAAERDRIVSDSESSLEGCAFGSTYFRVDLERNPLVLRVCAAFIGCILSTAEFLGLREKPLKNGMKRARWQCVRLLVTAVLATKY